MIHQLITEIRTTTEDLTPNDYEIQQWSNLKSKIYLLDEILNRHSYKEALERVEYTESVLKELVTNPPPPDLL